MCPPGTLPRRDVSTARAPRRRHSP
jgi:hypothetical protein